MISRRTVLAGLGAAAVARGAWLRAAPASLQLSILTDEISQDFGHACEVASRDFGMGLVDLREAGGKNLMNWDAAQIAEVRKVVDRFNLRVACLATPIFKVDWPDAPKSPFSPKRDEFGASFTFAQQDELLERAFELAGQFRTDRIRVFDFWRLEDQKPHRAAIDEVVQEGGSQSGEARPDARARERVRLQHRDRRRSGTPGRGHSRQSAPNHLGSGQRAVPR